ncbi:MAG TPA: hypothetical protein PKC72_16980 [Chitinophagaceae bacterium]|nr:hypothetical protein [Chitinophagaceae bacterium]
MKKNIPGICLFITIPLLFSCTESRPDLIKEESEIRQLLQQERKAHFERNADLFISEFSENMLSVNKGQVMTASPKERKDRIQRYFNNVEFIKWDDLAGPIIRFSDDGSLAYAIIQKEVIVNRKDSTGISVPDTSHFAWASIYRKEKGEWKVEANISTNK